MSHPAFKAFYSLSHEQQNTETAALSDVFLAYLEEMAYDAPACDLPGYHAELIAEIREQRADNARLRALVKAVEWQGCVGRDSDPACPWCGAEPEPIGSHAPTCPAFAPDGKVK